MPHPACMLLRVADQQGHVQWDPNICCLHVQSIMSYSFIVLHMNSSLTDPALSKHVCASGGLTLLLRCEEPVGQVLTEHACTCAVKALLQSCIEVSERKASFESQVPDLHLRNMIRQTSTAVQTTSLLCPYRLYEGASDYAADLRKYQGKSSGGVLPFVTCTLGRSRLWIPTAVYG